MDFCPEKGFPDVKIDGLVEGPGLEGPGMAVGMPLGVMVVDDTNANSPQAMITPPPEVQMRG